MPATVLHTARAYPFGEEMVAQHAGGVYATRYKFNGKELDPQTGYYYYGARYYDPVISRWLSVDPLAEKYPGLSPYNYTANNPVMLVDPDGMKVINADKIRLSRWIQLYKEFKSSADYKKFYGLTRKEVIKQFGKSGLKKWRKIRRYDRRYRRKISVYKRRAAKTDYIIKKWKKESPNLFNKIDNMEIDFYLGVDDKRLSKLGAFGYTDPPLREGNKYIYKVSDLGFEGGLGVMIDSRVNLDSPDKETEQYSLNHEAGHFIFAVEHPDQYFEDYDSIKNKGEDYDGGHHPDARTGKVADKYGQQKDIE